MLCSETHVWMSLQLDGLLDQEETERLHRHLAECATCRREWEAMCAVSQLLDAAPMAVPAPGLSLRVSRRVAKSAARRRRALSVFGVLLGSAGLWVAAGLVTAAVLLVLWRAPLRILWTSAGLPLAREGLSIARVLLNALYAVATEVARRPTALLLFGYAVFAFGLTLLWTQVVFRRAQQTTD